MSKNKRAVKSLLVKGIPKEVSNQELGGLFSTFGTLSNVSFYSNPDKHSKVAFLTYSTIEQADYARQNIENYRFPEYSHVLHCFFNYKEDDSKSYRYNNPKHSKKFQSTAQNSAYQDNSFHENEHIDPASIRVLVTHVENASFFWGQPIFEDDFIRPVKTIVPINAYCQSIMNGETNTETVLDPIYHAAKFADGKWYRVEIKSNGEDPANILFIDYGNSSTERLMNLIPLPQRYCTSPLCYKYCIGNTEDIPDSLVTNRERITFLSKMIFDKTVCLTKIHQHPDDLNCTVVGVTLPSADGGIRNVAEELNNYDQILSNSYSYSESQHSTITPSTSNNPPQYPNSQLSQTTTSQYDNSTYSAPQSQSQYQQITCDANPVIVPNYVSSNTLTLISQGTQQPSPLAPSNQFIFPTTMSQQLHQQQPLQHQHQQQQQQQQQQHYPHNSAFESYNTNSSSNPLLPIHSNSVQVDQQLCHPNYDPLHGPELINRYRQELEDMDERMKATSGRVISLETQNSELMTKLEELESPTGFQRLLDTMTDKLTEFAHAKKQLYSGPDFSCLRDIANEVLSNRSRFSLNQMSEVVEMHSIQDQLVGLIAQIRSTSEGEECPSLSQLINQRNDCRCKLIRNLSCLIETLGNFPLEERTEELNAIHERLIQIPGYSPENAKDIELTVCLETFDSVQSFDMKELKVGQEDEAGLDELCAKLHVSFKYFTKLLTLDPSEEIGEEKVENASELIHKIIQTADCEIAGLKMMEDIQSERWNTASSSLTNAVAYELERELAEVQSIKTSLLPRLKNELELLKDWDANPPSLTKLQLNRKEIKKLRADLRHLRVDMREALEDSDIYNLGDIQININTLLAKFHQSLLTEHEQMLIISKQFHSHFSELFILYPDLPFARQVEFGPIYMHSWEVDYFGNCTEISIFPEPTNLTTFNQENCLLREIKFSDHDQQSILVTNVNKLIQIEHHSVLKCDAMFFNKPNTKAFLKHPMIEGTNILDYIQSEKSCRLSTKFLLSEILHGLMAIHSSGLYCRYLTEKDIFVNSSSVLITGIELQSEASGPELHAYHRNDLFNFCTLILSLFYCYKRDFIDSRVGDCNIEGIVKTSGLNEETMKFALYVLNESSTPSSLVDHPYFDQLSNTVSTCEREATELVETSIILEFQPENPEGDDEEVEKLMNNDSH
ncbi:Serine/threonine-protein kinase 31-like [Oopsacas minuta]|uniref:Serine/threonine-protein kinase 31-like n=1 Tax=Oopsacas minuta TaxID=111878 RepID=A0AAV7KIT3_9METZ|nr:Serine/threonine-protein kinase 31-like [Oopsacas minuta]